jgi:aldose 1-epimerase
LILQVPGQTVLRPDERGLPIWREAVEGTDYDFRQPKRIGSIKLDHAFTDLERDTDGFARVELQDSDRETKVSLWVLCHEVTPVHTALRNCTRDEDAMGQAARV